MFHLRYYEEPVVERFRHRIKILHRTEKITPLPSSLFFELPASLYCSLGEAAAYYESLAQLDVATRDAILNGLNDIAADPRRAEEFTEITGYHGSLLRFSEAEKAFNEGRRILDKIVIDEHFRFAFSTTVPGAASPHIVEFDFTPDLTQLNRVHALIGRNGTGKTQFLASFANAMSGLDRGQGNFTLSPPESQSSRPPFSKVIAVSYSVFDEFERPEEAIFSYKYCGIRYADRLLSAVELTHIVNTSYRQVVNLGRRETWARILNELLDGTFSATAFDNDEARMRYWRSLSSGQRILVVITTEIVAHIERDSILLFDEPEIHLHPDVLSALARSLQLLLQEFKSYGIVATHSPILLQEVPSRYVRIFRRTGSIPLVQPLTIESFGENLTTINDEVFESEQARNNYRVYLARLADQYEYEEVLAMFSNKLGLNARAFLRSLYSTSERK